MAFRHLLSILLLPVMVLGVVPAAILYSTKSFDPGWSLSGPLQVVTLLLGIIFVVLGLVLLARTISLFISAGEGTISPWDPTQKLVVEGIYRYVRNPMISGVITVLVGETLALGSPSLVIYLIFAVTINLIYIPLVEEPGLEERFGEDYQLYKENVSRWIPRQTPWNGLAKNRPRAKI